MMEAPHVVGRVCPLEFFRRADDRLGAENATAEPA
jgi:hypothetical protein